MKKFLAILLAAMLLLSLAACGGDKTPSGSEDNTPGSQQQEQNTPDPGTSQGNNTKPEKEWPTEQITAWSGSGKIVRIDDLSSDAKDYTCYYIVNVDTATLDEFTAYISELKSAGFSYKSMEEEPSAGYKEDDYSYSWNGYTTDGKRVQITLSKNEQQGVSASMNVFKYILEIAMWIE